MSIKIGNFEIKPNEINTIKYWLHLLIIVVIVYALINTFVQPMEITIKNVLLGIIFVGISDIISHSILKID